MLRSCGYLFIEYNVSSASGFLDALEEVLSVKLVTGAGSGSSERFLRYPSILSVGDDKVKLMEPEVC